MRRSCRQFEPRGGFGFKGRLLRADLIGRPVPMPFAQPYSYKSWYIDGGKGDDVIKGGKKSDYLYGDKDDDHLYGNDGKDYLWGGKGDDYLDGGKDKDHLWGGEGCDVFVFSDLNYPKGISKNCPDLLCHNDVDLDQGVLLGV